MRIARQSAQVTKTAIRPFERKAPPTVGGVGGVSCRGGFAQMTEARTLSDRPIERGTRAGEEPEHAQDPPDHINSHTRSGAVCP